MMVALLLALSLIAAPGAGQVRRQPGAAPPDAKVGTTIALTVGATAYQFTGQAKCEHLSRGSIYNTVAERWSVNQSENGRSLMLNMWKPVAGGDNLITLYVTTGGKNQVVDTGAPTKKGSGTVTLTPEGKGGTFTINATTDSGAKVSGTIKCDAFTASEAVAGN
jgi:hypothetical protein